MFLWESFKWDKPLFSTVMSRYGDRGGSLQKKVELTLFNFGFLRLHFWDYYLNFYGSKDAPNMETGTVVLCHIASPEKITKCMIIL